MKRLLLRFFRVGEPAYPDPYDPTRDPLLPKIRAAKRQTVILRDRWPGP